MTRRRPSALPTLKVVALTLLAVLSVAAMTVMGFWQLDAYQQRQALDAAETAQADPVPLDRLLGPDQAFTQQAHARPVVVRGEYADRQFVVERDEGPDWAVAPLVTDTGSAILVVRGLVEEPAAAGAENSAVPAPPDGPVRVTGSLQPSEVRGTDPDPRDDRVPTLSTAQLVDAVDTDLYSGFVVLTEQAPPETLPRAAPPTPDASFTAGLRNLMYAVQWWVFAGFGVFLWWRMVREETGQTRARATDEAGDAAPVA